MLGLRDFEPRDEDAVLSIFEARRDYFEADTGYLPGQGDVQSLFYVLPQGATPAQKRIMVIEANGAVAGLVDIVVDYPVSGTASVGLFILEPGASADGQGKSVAALLLDRAAAEGIETIHAGCPVGWARGEAFLERLGFEPSARGSAEMNRVIHANESRTESRRWVKHLTT